MSDNIEDFFSAKELDEAVFHRTTWRSFIQAEVYSLQRSINEDGRRFYPLAEIRDHIRNLRNDLDYLNDNFHMILRVHTYCTKLFCTEQFDFLATDLQELEIVNQWFREISPHGIVSYQHYVGITNDPQNRTVVGRVLFSDYATLVLFKLGLGHIFQTYDGADCEWAI